MTVFNVVNEGKYCVCEKFSHLWVVGYTNYSDDYDYPLPKFVGSYEECEEWIDDEEYRRLLAR